MPEPDRPIAAVQVCAGTSSVTLSSAVTLTRSPAEGTRDVAEDEVRRPARGSRLEYGRLLSAHVTIAPSREPRITGARGCPEVAPALPTRPSRRRTVGRVTPAASPATTAWEGLGRRRFLLTTWPWRALAHTALTLVRMGLLRAPGGRAGGAVRRSRRCTARSRVRRDRGCRAASPGPGSRLRDPAPARLAPPRRGPRTSTAGGSEATPAAGAGASGSGRLAAGPLPDSRALAPAAYLVACITWQTALLAVLVLLGTSAGALLAAPALASRSVPINVGPWQANTPVETWTLAVLGALLLAVLAYAWTLGACLQVALLRWTLVTDRAGELEARLTEVDASRARLVDASTANAAGSSATCTTARSNGCRPHPPARPGPAGRDRRTRRGARPRRRGVGTRAGQGADGRAAALVHGIHPQLLTDLGLAAALDELAGGAPSR